MAAVGPFCHVGGLPNRDVAFPQGFDLADVLPAIAQAAKRPAAHRKPQGRRATATLQVGTLVRDGHIRAALRQVVKRKQPELIIKEEMVICSPDFGARIDFITISDCLHGYEIKSEVDTLRRLDRQREVYVGALDRVTLVADEKHIKALTGSDRLPTWWGIVMVKRTSTDAIELIELRESRLNPATDEGAFVRLMWRPELEVLLNESALSYDRRCRTEKLRELVLKGLPFSTVHRRALAMLRMRSHWHTGISH
jgi:hypothetical protein